MGISITIAYGINPIVPAIKELPSLYCQCFTTPTRYSTTEPIALPYALITALFSHHMLECTVPTVLVAISSISGSPDKVGLPYGRKTALPVTTPIVEEGKRGYLSGLPPFISSLINQSNRIISGVFRFDHSFIISDIEFFGSTIVIKEQCIHPRPLFPLCLE